MIILTYGSVISDNKQPEVQQQRGLVVIWRDAVRDAGWSVTI